MSQSFAMSIEKQVSEEHLAWRARPEDDLLICIARRTLEVPREALLHRLLGRDLDWDYLLAIADRHSLIPLLHYHLNSIDSRAVPPAVMSRLEEMNRENTRFNFFLTGELLKLMTLLQDHGIEAIPFKGPTLALSAYGDIGLRQFGDLDILIRKQDFPAFRDLLIGHGFTPRPALTSAQQAGLLRFDCSHNFANAKNVWVDVHWDIVAPYYSVKVRANRLWEHLQPVTLNGRQLLTLSTEDLLLILCLHGFTHLWERLGWICDLASLIERKKNIDWQLLLRNATRLGSGRILSLGLHLASELLDAPVPPDVFHTVPADAEVKMLVEQVQQQLFGARTQPTGIFNEVSLHLKMRERTRDKVAACLRLVATPRSNDWKSFSLPDSLFFLYYPLRPIRLAAKFAAGLIRG